MSSVQDFGFTNRQKLIRSVQAPAWQTFLFEAAFGIVAGFAAGAGSALFVLLLAAAAGLFVF